MHRAPLFLLASLLLVPLSTFAVEREHILLDGTDQAFTFGWQTEPALVGVENALVFRVAFPNEHDMMDPSRADVTELDPANVDLSVVASTEGVERTFPLSFASSTRSFIVPITPTDASPVSFRIFGTVNDVPFDLLIPCGASTTEETADVQVSPTILRAARSGGIPCPVFSADTGFPHPARGDASGLAQGLRADSVEHSLNAFSRTTRAAIAFSVFALCLGALSLWRTRRT